MGVQHFTFPRDPCWLSAPMVISMIFSIRFPALLLENREARRIVQDLEDRVSNLTFDLETVRNVTISQLYDLI